MSNSKKKLIAVVGPTGSGKTDLAVELAKKYNGVLISADSRQVYRGLDIGTNKEGVPGNWQGETAQMIGNIPQLLVDVVDPGSSYTLHDWLTEARRLVEKIWQNGQPPIVVGGTGLYVSALVSGYQPGKGRYAKTKIKPAFKSLILLPNKNRTELFKKSDQRFERLFDAIVLETKELIARGVSIEWLKQIGLDYRYAAKYIDGELSRDEAILQYRRVSHQYIRRQLTWWRHHEPTMCIGNVLDAQRELGDFLHI